MYVYVGGTFDMFHVGHLELLRLANSLGPVIVSLNTDEFVERYKGKKPIICFNDRFSILDSCLYVNRVIKNIGDEDSKKTIKSLLLDGYKISFIVHGDDWMGESLYKQMDITKQWLNDNKISMVYFKRNTGESSTNIKKRCTE